MYFVIFKVFSDYQKHPKLTRQRKITLWFLFHVLFSSLVLPEELILVLPQAPERQQTKMPDKLVKVQVNKQTRCFFIAAQFGTHDDVDVAIANIHFSYPQSHSWSQIDRVVPVFVVQ